MNKKKTQRGRGKRERETNKKKTQKQKHRSRGREKWREVDFTDCKEKNSSGEMLLGDGWGMPPSVGRVVVFVAVIVYVRSCECVYTTDR